MKVRTRTAEPDTESGLGTRNGSQNRTRVPASIPVMGSGFVAGSESGFRFRVRVPGSESESGFRSWFHSGFRAPGSGPGPIPGSASGFRFQVRVPVPFRVQSQSSESGFRVQVPCWVTVSGSGFCSRFRSGILVRNRNPLRNKNPDSGSDSGFQLLF